MNWQRCVAFFFAGLVLTINFELREFIYSWQPLFTILLISAVMAFTEKALLADLNKKLEDAGHDPY